jgi:hypothetical protein
MFSKSRGDIRVKSKSTTPVVHLELRISPRITDKFETIFDTQERWEN